MNQVGVFRQGPPCDRDIQKILALSKRLEFLQRLNQANSREPTFPLSRLLYHLEQTRKVDPKLLPQERVL